MKNVIWITGSNWSSWMDQRPSLNLLYHKWTVERLTSSPQTVFIIWKVSTNVFPRAKQNLMFVRCSKSILKRIRNPPSELCRHLLNSFYKENHQMYNCLWPLVRQLIVFAIFPYWNQPHICSCCRLSMRVQFLFEYTLYTSSLDSQTESLDMQEMVYVTKQI